MSINENKNIETFYQFTRNFPKPLDKYSVFSTYEDALDYIKNNPSAYATQIIGVDNKELLSTDVYKVVYDSQLKDGTFALERINASSSCLKILASENNEITEYYIPPFSVLNKITVKIINPYLNSDVVIKNKDKILIDSRF